MMIFVKLINSWNLGLDYKRPKFQPWMGKLTIPKKIKLYPMDADIKWTIL